jgi:hypothetical protein
MSLSRFATKHHLQVTKDSQDNTSIISGRNGQIYEHSDHELGVMIMPPNDSAPRLWAFTRTKGLSLGMTVQQNGDAERVLSFNPENKEQVRFAIRAAGVRPKKQISEAHKAKLLAGLQAFKNSGVRPILGGVFSC